jgi:LmbE family N-acetylglucosaminyl deacetylase
VWDYPDGQLMEAHWPKIEKRIAALIRRTRPHVVITFGPEGGGNQHPDHQAVSVLTTAACQGAGDAERYPDLRLQRLQPYTPPKLYYMTAPSQVARESGIEFMPVTTIIDIRETADVKLAAFRCHASQQADYPQLEECIKAYKYKEYYHRVCPRVKRKARMERDLFEGL